MTTATFRFYARLNHFLSVECRGQSFDCRCARAATTKHMIEALGVPHTEVALVLVNGQPASLERAIVDGDRVAVYPKFEQLDVSSLSALQALPPGPPRFVADAHLGGLARLLRMAGFDTLYDNHFEDAAMAELANREQRVLLTRDRALLMHRRVLHGCYVQAVRPQKQLRELYHRLDLAAHARPFSLCMTCNAPLQPVDKATVLDRLPPRVQARHQRFLGCD
nr:Mut7-C ubiquitin/RNAse domain-containing protein [Stutzerimonas stutzeri]